MDILIDTVENSLWAAAIQDGSLQGIEIDPPLEGVRWGSVYYARVARIDKGLNAAFLELGHGEQGILYAKDYRQKDKDGKTKGNEGKAIGQILRSGAMILVQAKTSTLPVEMHQDITVDADKVARMSMDIAIPGRHLIFTPNDGQKRVSSRVQDKALRKQMLAMVRKVETIQGCILRSSAASVQTDVLVRESQILKQIWEELKKFQTGEVPSLIMDGPDAIQRIISDHADQRIGKILTSDESLYEEAHEWCDIYAPDLLPRVEHVPFEDAEAGIEDIHLLDHFGIVDQVQELIRPYAVLPDGGNIIMQQTNALMAIDVNTGQSKSKTKTNLEAAYEAARQIRLRNVGGMILIDFIDSRSKKHRDAILKILKEACADDPCRIDVHGFTGGGLMEISRARRTAPLMQRLQIATAVHDA